ncbi:MAG: metallophosphoesterase family protein [Gemmataceae bacterium]
MARLRLIHLSDIHIREARPGWVPRDFLTKRTSGWVNLLRRGRRFDRALHVISHLIADVKRTKPDALIFSGDASALGFRSEVQAAAIALHVGDSRMPPAIAVPGNHDHYIRAAASSDAFESAFIPWMVGHRIEPHRYPFAREIGGMWFIGVNSCKPNRLAWDASGAVGHTQLARIDRLLGELPLGPRTLVTHYPFSKDDGRPEPYWHGLRDRVALASLLEKHDVRLWLCGHRHANYALPPSRDIPFAQICAGSSTQAGRASYMEVLIDDATVTVKRHVFQGHEEHFLPANEPVNIPGVFE